MTVLPNLQQVRNPVAARHQVAGDESPVAPKPDGLGAHQRRQLPFGELFQLGQPALEGGALHPCRVAPLSKAPQVLPQPDHRDALPGQLTGQRLTVELRIAPGSGTGH